MNRSAGDLRINSYSLLSFPGVTNKRINELTLENQNLRKELIDQNNLVSENKALKDQFAASNSNSLNLLPAEVIGAPGFLPGVSLPDYLIIDKGSSQGVLVGSTIVVGNNLVGQVVQVWGDFSKVELVNNQNSTFTATTLASSSQALGIIRGQGNGSLIFDNVLLSASLKKDDLVITKGDKNEKGFGYPPDLVVGKVISVEKKPSDLFQRAAVGSLVDFVNLKTVFVIR